MTCSNEQRRSSSFKPGTDDLRESPIVEVVERLVGKGYDVSIYAPEVRLAQLDGANRRFIEQRLTHLDHMLRDDLNLVLQSSDLLMIGHPTDEFKRGVQRHHSAKIVVDLPRLFSRRPEMLAGYETLV